MTVKEALRLVLNNQHVPSLNYAVNYAAYGVELDEGSDEMRVQCLYVLNNISRWRVHKDSATTAEEIKEARKAIKLAAGVK
jgi:hypothetical protein